MPEIKNQFTGGKMNKDLDERLVPKGEYRDAMNIQVSTSEGSDVGTVQNILGNEKILIESGIVITNGKTIGSIADEKNDTFYYLISTEDKDGYRKNYILGYGKKLGSVQATAFHVFVDNVNSSLPFKTGELGFTPNTIITGINIIDDMLFWTDGVTEPKKINITRSIQGTNSNGLDHTKLINQGQNINIGSNIDVMEKHITVIKKAPKSVLSVETENTSGFAFGTSNSSALNLGGFSLNDNIPSITLLSDPNSPTFNVYGGGLNVGDVIVFNLAVQGVSLPQDEYIFSISLDSLLSSNVLGLGVTNWAATVVGISGTVPSSPQQYNWAVKKVAETFENVFPRFSYRYKYQDGEYSTFAPFTKVVFEAGNFRYNIKEAFNLGMENKITSVNLFNYDVNIPEDVDSIDFLYKESNSPIVYTIENVKKSYITTGSLFEVRPKHIKAALPENQMLRAYDNVPKKALAQEVTGSRIVYGNYTQNYTVSTDPIIEAGTSLRSYCDLSIDDMLYGGTPSVKSMRNYSLGVSFLDKYGRQSPVFTTKQGDVGISIKDSKNANQISAQLLGYLPSWASFYKVFVKETSSEYYNLAMDRIYDARDGNIWLSFPSSDRNKVDEETFLILKKSVEGGGAIEDKNRYKILAIENEAPEFIKTRRYKLGKVQESASSATNTYFTFSTELPTPNRKTFSISDSAWDTAGLPLDDRFDNGGQVESGGGKFKNLSVQFSVTSGGIELTSRIYEVVNFNHDVPFNKYEFALDKTISEDEDWLLSAPNAATLNDTIGLTVYRNVVKNSPQFDGRFFVKVRKDVLINSKITQQSIASQTTTMQATTSVPFYYVSDGSDPNAPSNMAALLANTGASNVSGSSILDTIEEWDDVFQFGLGGSYAGSWFIDNTNYEGFYGPSDHAYLQDTGIWNGVSNQYSNYTGTSDEVPNSKTSGHNKGIHTDANGDHFMHITFGGVQSDIGNSSSYQTSKNQIHTKGFPLPNTQVDEASRCVWEMQGFPPFGNFYCNSSRREALWEGIYDWQDQNDHINRHWKLGSTTNSVHQDQLDVHTALTTNGQQFKFTGDTLGTLYTITGDTEVYYHLNHFNTANMDLSYDTSMAQYPTQGANPTSSYTLMLFDGTGSSAPGGLYNLGHTSNRRITYRVPLDKNPTSPTSPFNPLIGSSAANAYNSTQSIQFVEFEHEEYAEDQIVSENPAVWETEPRNSEGLDIYHEIDGTFPFTINNDTNYLFAPVGTTITHPTVTTSYLGQDAKVVSWNDNILELDTIISDATFAATGTGFLTFHREDGSCVQAKLIGLATPYTMIGLTNTSIYLEVSPSVARNPINLSWFNCYSFGNGVESNRIRDDYNQVTIDKGAKVSAVLDEPYEEEHRKYGLIYSGLYNSTSGVNNLNQFIQAEKITKDLNPTYGSIQKLHARDSDLVALCEDKILRILANKDAVFNADGDMQLTSTNNVLGQAIPFSGEHGISTNPESFASESYRAYFTDKTRGSVMRLSKDGLTPISNHGMKDWFRDNLKLSEKLIGSYDDKKDEYNITLKDRVVNSQVNPKTVTFKENVKGWVSFKSFIPENAISCANEYYTFKNSNLWKHHVETTPETRNTFYGSFNSNNHSTISVILNDSPGTVKSFQTLNYEGSQSRVVQLTTDPVTGLTDGQYYNLASKEGWSAEYIHTDKQKGTVEEFIKKEGKWFNHIKGLPIQHVSGTNTAGDPVMRVSVDINGNSIWE